MNEHKHHRHPASRASQPGSKHPRRSARHLLLFAKRPSPRTWWIAAGAILLLGVIGTAVFLLTDLDWHSVQGALERLNDSMERLHPAAVIPLMVVLPIFGFPIAFVYVVAGARFGPLVGGGIVAAVTAVHLLATYYIGRSFLRAPIERFMEKRHHHLPHVPEDEQALVCVIAALIPGLPYFVRNYLLVLADVKLRYLMLVCLPIYVARSYVSIMLGNLSNDPTSRGLIMLVIFDVLKIAICAFVIWRLREHHRKFHPAHPHDEAGVAAPPTGAGK